MAADVPVPSEPGARHPVGPVLGHPPVESNVGADAVGSAGTRRVPSTCLRLVVLRPGNTVRAAGISPPHYLATQLPRLDGPAAVAPHDRLRAPWRVPRETELNWRELVPDRSRISHALTQPIVSLMSLEYSAAGGARVAFAPWPTPERRT